MQIGLWFAVFDENDIFTLDGRNDTVQVRFIFRRAREAYHILIEKTLRIVFFNTEKCSHRSLHFFNYYSSLKIMVWAVAASRKFARMRAVYYPPSVWSWFLNQSSACSKCCGSK